MRCFVSMMLVVAAICSVNAMAVMVSLEPAAQQVEINDSVSLDVVISGLSDTEVSTFDFNLLFDDSVLTFDSYALSDQLGVVGVDADDLSSGDLGSGVVHIAEFSWLMDLGFQADSFTTATVNFTAAAEGHTNVNVAVNALGDLLGDELDAQLGSACVTVVPEPATLLLSMAGIAFLRKRNS